MDYYISSEIDEKHLVFFGRWVPFHKGHEALMLKVYNEKKLPILIFVRSSKEEMSPEERAGRLIDWLIKNNIQGAVMIIPDIEGIYYGRGVGYNVEQIELDKETHKISGTKIRAKINSGIDMDKIDEVV